MTDPAHDWPQRLGKAARAWHTARAKEAAAREAARQLAIEAITAGQSEAGTARALGMSRTALRDWLGKRKR